LSCKNDALVGLEEDEELTLAQDDQDDATPTWKLRIAQVLPVVKGLTQNDK
jgi:hypothetical protein